MSLPSAAFQEITWREGTDRKLRSRFAAVRVHPAHRDYEKAEPRAEEWLLIEWPVRRERTHQVLDVDNAARYQAQGLDQGG
jgi:SRSO17 transposase